MFKFFSKNKDEDEELEKTETGDQETEKTEDLEEAIASITYYVKEGDSQDVFLDIYISNYEEDTLKKLAKILSGLSSLRLSVETIKMIKESLIDSGDSDTFFKLIDNVVGQTKKETDVLQQMTNKINQVNKEKEEEDQPWIKPSEIIR